MKSKTGFKSNLLLQQALDLGAQTPEPNMEPISAAAGNLILPALRQENGHEVEEDVTVPSRRELTSASVSHETTSLRGTRTGCSATAMIALFVGHSVTWTLFVVDGWPSHGCCCSTAIRSSRS